jgi:hypothetical protein
MEQEKSFLNELEEKEKLGTLKTLTVLTFIGSGIFFLLSAWGFANGKSGYEKMQQALSDGTVDKLPDFLKGMYSPEKMEVMRKSVENGLPIFIINTIALALCVYGAIQMRKLKAEGYWMWLIGEILPNLAILFFVGAGYFSGMFSYIGLAIIALFIILYSLQKKHLS